MKTLTRSELVMGGLVLLAMLAGLALEFWPNLAHADVTPGTGSFVKKQGDVMTGNLRTPQIHVTTVDAGTVKAAAIDAGVIDARGPIRAAGDIESIGGRLVSRNASGGMSIGVSGTQYWGIAAGSNVLTTNAAILDLTGLSSVKTNSQFTAYSGAPTISSGFGTSPSVASNGGTWAFSVNVGTGGTANSGVIGFPVTATNGWRCDCADITTKSATVFLTKQTATSTTTCTVGNYDAAGAAAAWVASDILVCDATGY